MISNINRIYIRNIIVILLLGTFFSQGCREECDPVDVDSLNAFYFQFKTSGANAFNSNELDSVFIVRFQDVVPDSFSFPVDTLTFYNGVLGFDDYTIRLSQGEPFRDVPPPYFPDYKYKIESTNQDFEFRIEQIRLEGNYIGECDYLNTQKSLVFEGDTLSFVAGVDEIILMEKP